MRHRMIPPPARTFALLAALALSAAWTGCNEDQVVVVPPGESPAFKLTDFTPSSNCEPCHPQYVREWRASMHRYSTSDPVWMLANNSLQSSVPGGIGKTCFQCHAPLGFLTDNAPPTFGFADLDSFVREGITCDFCHVLRPPYLSTDQQIRYTLEPGRVKYGAIPDPQPTSAHDHGYDPDYDRSVVCRQCHDLTVNGVPVEVTFTEWQKSAWGGMSVECQDCHMKTYTGRAATTGPVRDGLHRHSFVGVDVALSDFPDREEQRAEADSLLKNAATLSLEAPPSLAGGAAADIRVTVTNDRTGHNLPTSVFFNRQMWIELTVWSGTDTIYRSGHLDANGDLMDANSAISPGADSALVIFNGELLRNGRPSNVVELDSLVNRSLAPFESRTSHYRFTAGAAGSWRIRARLLYRPLGPYLLRSLGADEYVPELPIFEMASREASMVVG